MNNNGLSSIIILIPFFGRLPVYFQPWLISAGANSSIDFLIFTDDEREFDFPSNVKRYIITFEEMKNMVQKNFDFTVCIDFPYKLCDFKVAYGEIFAEYIKEYDFWGFCDIDLILGNLRKFLTESVLKANVRIFETGQFAIYKNQKDINVLYRKLYSKGCMDYKKVYTTHELMAFDEEAMHNGGGTTIILQRNNIPVYVSSNDYLSADEFKARLYNKRIGYFFVLYKEGGVYLYTKRNVYEQVYFHFHQKKKYCEVEKDLSSYQFYYISPGKFVNAKSNKFWLEICKIDVRNIFKKIYVIMGEPKWRWIVKLLR